MNGKGSRNRTSNHKAFAKGYELIYGKSKEVIPEGLYCYERISENKIKLCPHWRINKDKPEQMNGYCSFLKKGDWEMGALSLLWDQCKECGINIGEE